MSSPYDGEWKPAESPSTGKRVSGHNGLTLHCKGGFMLIFHALKQNACQSKRTDRNLLFALPHVLSVARVRENWFLGLTKHGAILTEGCRDVNR